MPRPRSATRPLLLGVAASMLLVSLTASDTGAKSPGHLSRAAVTAHATSLLNADFGRGNVSVTCSSGAALKAGSIARCAVRPKGSTVTYPATFTVSSVRHGAAHFKVRLASANEKRFCSDNAAINATVGAAQSAAAFVASLVSGEKTLLDFELSAPKSVVGSAAVLVSAAAKSIKVGSPSPFNSSAVAVAATAVDKFCGYSPTQ